MDLWITAVDAWGVESSRSAFGDWLDDRERARHARLLFERHQHLFLISHAMLRRVLSLYVGVEPAQLRFSISPLGKPELVVPHSPSLHFNLSQTKGLAAVGVTGMGRLGVDVESGKPPETMIRLGRRFFAPSEVAVMERFPPGPAAALALELWSLKEAFMKAVGLGMELPPSRFAFDLENVGPRRLLTTGLEDELPAAWQFAAFPAEIHASRIALAVERAQGRSTPVRIFHVDPPQWSISALPTIATGEPWNL